MTMFNAHLWTKVRHYIIVIMLLVCPIYYHPAQTNAREAQEVFFQYMALLLCVTFIGNFWISAFLALNLFLFVYNGAVVGMNYVFNLFLGALIFRFARAFFKKNSFLDYFKYFYWLAVVTIGFMVLQMFSIDPIHVLQNADGTVNHSGMSDPVGMFGLKAANGFFLVLVTQLLLVSNPVIAGFMIIPILISKSSGVVLALAVAMGVFVFFRYRSIFKWFLLALSLGTALFLYIDNLTDHSTFKSRLPMWHAVTKLSLLNPIGYGPDSFRNYNTHKNFIFCADYDYNTGLEVKIDENRRVFKYLSASNNQEELDRLNKSLIDNGFKKNTYNFWDNPHNEYVKVLFEGGILALLLVFGFMREIFIRFRFSNKDNEVMGLFLCLVVYFVASIVQFPFDLARTAVFFPIILGGFYGRTDVEAN